MYRMASKAILCPLLSTKTTKRGGPKILTMKICKGPAQFQYFAIERIVKTSIFPL